MNYTWKTAAEEVLRSRRQQLHVVEILKEISSRSLKTTLGETPLQTLKTEMYRASTRQGAFSRQSPKVMFYQADNGDWGLAQWLTEPPIHQIDLNTQGDSTNSQSSAPKITSTPQEIYGIAAEDDEQAFPEGKEAYRLHRVRERNPQIIELAKRRRMDADPLLHCEVCNFSFVKFYGKLGWGFIEAHHVLPLSQSVGETETRIEDIVLVCSNCHRILHRRRPWPSTDDLKEIISKG